MNLGAAPDNVTRAQPSFAIVAPRRLFTSLHIHERMNVGWNMIAIGNLKTVLPAMRCPAELLAILLLMILCSSAHSQIMDIDVTVAKDGSGNFSKVQEAINQTPNFSPRRYKIHIKRAMGKFLQTIIMQSFLDNLIDPGGWLEWGGKGHSVDKVDYAEYENRGPGASTVGRVKWARVINSSVEATKSSYSRSFMTSQEEVAKGFSQGYRVDPI
ncbi:hypothetical protein C3L33_02253, partial [Rhododendron williamsianum]